MEFPVSAFLVSNGSYDSAVSLKDFGFTLTLGEPISIVLTGDNRFIDPADPGAVSVTVGDDEQGPVLSIEYREFTRVVDGETVVYAFARLAPDETAEYILIPIDPETGFLSDNPVPAASDYVAGEAFEPVPVGPLFNSAPLADADEAETDEDNEILVDVLANDTDADGDPLTLTELGEAANGTVTVVEGGVLYTPASDFSGEDTFDYTVSDGFVSSTGTVTVSVAAVNDAPTADDDSAMTDEDTAVQIDVLDGDGDVDGDTLTISGLGEASFGTVEIVEGQVLYTPDADANGEDSFTYTVSDGTEEAAATVTVTVVPVGDEPTAVADVAVIDEDAAVTVDVLANDFDVDGDTLTVTEVGPASLGAAVLDGGQILYTPEANANGEDSFTYTISDGGLTATATVTVTVSAVNDAPMASAVAVATDEDVAVTVDVLAGAADVDGDTLTIAALGAANAGTAEIVAGQVLYTPDVNANGEDSFTFTISDGTDETTETVTVSVSPIDDAPVAVDDVAATDEDVAVTIDVLANDVDADGDTLTISEVGTASFGTAVLQGGQILYTPDEDYFGTDSFDYTISDGVSTASATVTVSVANVPDLVTGGPEGGTIILAGRDERVVLGDGPDVLTGPSANFFGDVIENFGGDDEILFVEEIARRDMRVTEGSAIIELDTDGDGSFDGQFTLEGDFSGGDFMSVIDGGQSTLTFEEFLPLLAERQLVDPDLVNGIINQAFLTGNGTQDLIVTLSESAAAGFDNVLGAYEVTETGEIVDTTILFGNANEDQTASATISGVDDGHRVGFFLIQDGADWLAAQTPSAVFSFVNQDGTAAAVDDGVLSLAIDGVLTDQTVFHSFAETLNVDGVQHALSGVDPGGESLTVGFEDLTGGGDLDYQDVVFSIGFLDSVT